MFNFVSVNALVRTCMVWYIYMCDSHEQVHMHVAYVRTYVYRAIYHYTVRIVNSH